MQFLRDIRHLAILVSLLTLVAWGGVGVRDQLVPASYDPKLHYRPEVLAELARQPSVFPADQICHECHQSVQEERAGTDHETVRCAHCHGLGQEHVRLARAARDQPETVLPAAAEWDGDFETRLDLYFSRDRKACLVCHEAAIGMPEDFKKIDVAAHLEEQGAEDPLRKDVCLVCHGHHDTSP